MTMRKKEIEDLLYRNTDFQKPECRRLVNAVFEIIQDRLESGEEVLISGFGKWCILDKNARKGRNPQTGETLTLRARKTVKFRSSNLLRKELDAK